MFVMQLVDAARSVAEANMLAMLLFDFHSILQFMCIQQQNSEYFAQA